jgi:hypothetical protein
MKINEDCDTVEFRSRSPFFERERDGVKCNTVRVFLDENEEQKFVSSIFNLSKVTISCDGDVFSRLITDISMFIVNGQRIYIISWEGY